MRALEQIMKFNLSKREIDEFIKKVVEEIRESGDVDVLETAGAIKAMEEAIKGIKDGISSDILDEVDKWGGVVEKNGMVIERKFRRSYDYSNDSGWLILKEEIKNREALLRNSNGNIADTDTGEVLNKPIEKQTEYFTIKIRRG